MGRERGSKNIVVFYGWLLGSRVGKLSIHMATIEKSHASNFYPSLIRIYGMNKGLRYIL